MKYKIKVLFILTMLLLFPHIVAADQIDAKDIELECVYDSAVVITAFKDGEYYGMGSSDMKLSITSPVFQKEFLIVWSVLLKLVI